MPRRRLVLHPGVLQVGSPSVQLPPSSASDSSARIRIVPLGGLGEIGMNCFALEQAGGIVIVDCGAAFADDDVGIDVWHPDFSWLLAQRERVHGVFLTHGHEDHLGALPYLLSELELPVWGPPHALEIAKRRLLEHQFVPAELDLREAHAGQEYQVGPFTIEPVRVAHSIIEASALHMRTAVGSVLHTGDFNFDPDPPDGEPTNEARLTELGDQGISLLLSDSTNIDVPVRTGSERGVGAALEELVQNAPARVVIAMFASNIQRLILLGEIAQRTGRKLCLFGRSLETQCAVARQIGRLSWPSDLLVSSDQAASVPRERLLVLAGGTQAERNSALKRLSIGQHPRLQLAEGDTVIFSSRIIPGNDRPVFAMMNDLLRAGITLNTRFGDPGVHTSGHATKSWRETWASARPAWSRTARRSCAMGTSFGKTNACRTAASPSPWGVRSSPVKRTSGGWSSAARASPSSRWPSIARTSWPRRQPCAPAACLWSTTTSKRCAPWPRKSRAPSRASAAVAAWPWQNSCAAPHAASSKICPARARSSKSRRSSSRSER